MEFNQQNKQIGDDKDKLHIDAGATMMQSRIGDILISKEGDNGDSYNGELCDTMKITGKIHDAEYVKRVSYK